MNPIENVWGSMVQEFDAQRVQNADLLWDAVRDLWQNFANRQRYWQVLAASMPNRLQLVIEAEGGWTKY
jgi:hypothetical protein